MVHVLPFRALRHDPDNVTSLTDVTAPPYDVIDKAMQKKLYDQSPYNIARLDFAMVEDGDNNDNNIYSRARDQFKQWQIDRVLIAEKEPAFYAYGQVWTDPNGNQYLRKGFLGLLKIEEFTTGQVLPHEFTLRGPKLDRMNLMQSTMANFSPIFMIYADDEQQVEKELYEGITKNNISSNKDWLKVEGHDDVQHYMKPILDVEKQARIQHLFEDQKLLIADGHHRYETALAFKHEARQAIKEKYGEAPPDGHLLSDYLMVFCANMHDPGVQVFPTDRVLYNFPEGWDASTFEVALREYFDETNSKPDFKYRTKEKTLSLKLKNKDAMAHLHKSLQDFDCAILEEVVFKTILKQSGEDLKAHHHLGFYRDADKVQSLIKSAEAVGAFIMEAPDIEHVREICVSGERMPQKSTYFYPKIITGLTLLSFQHFAVEPGHTLDHLAPVQAIDDSSTDPLFANIDASCALVPDH